MVYILVTKIGPSSPREDWTHENLAIRARFWRLPAPLAWLRGRLKGILRRPKSRRSIARSFPALDRAPPETASITSGPKSLRPTPPLDTASAPSTSPEAAGRDLSSTGRVAPPSTEAARSDKEAKVQFAYASLEGAAPALGAPSAVTPPAETAAREPSARASCDAGACG